MNTLVDQLAVFHHRMKECVLIDGWRLLAPSPLEEPVLLQESLKGTTSRASIEPNCNLTCRYAYGGLEDEEEFARRVAGVDSELTRIEFT